ncbi:DUF3592 domain-containing protein [Microlunatus elymi]|uniref:DUF3592 domain-containing protein n=1 Tax=Microlunatus elymi TaxID=2596828 RepID=A0A516PUA8_9ACTN|nr:DUF3592 domain-containing protein [Microlunatus elymi]QDP94785.1 DUF3592 domain-containing protein [Microlunatus elymi]
MTSSDLVFRLLPLAFLVGGILMLIFGVRTAVGVRHRRLTWLRYQGEAFDYVWDNSGDSSTQHWMIRWIDNQGVQRTARNPYGVSGGTLKSFPFPVEILVNPDDPRQGQVAGGAQSGLTVAIAFIAAGVVFALVGAVWSVSTLIN